VKKTVWLNPINFVSGEKTLYFTYPKGPHSNAIVSSTVDNNSKKWISMDMQLPENVSIDQLNICYRVTSKNSFISMILLEGGKEPGQSNILYKDDTPLNRTTSSIYTSNLGGIKIPSLAITLHFRLEFESKHDQIILGAIGVNIQSEASDLDWWRDAETYHISALTPTLMAPGEDGQFDWYTIAKTKESFTTHCPIDRRFIDRCHSMGVRCFPYVVFFMGPDLCTFGPIQSNTYEGVEWEKHHDLFELDKDGNERLYPFVDPQTGNILSDGVGVQFPELPKLVCPNVETYHVMMINWVEYIMQQGADGIFVDVLRNREGCYPPHPHIYGYSRNDPDNIAMMSQNKAFALLLKKVRKTVKSYRSNGLVIGNSGDPLNLGGNSPPEFQEYLDADTIRILTK
jgi:hypothetical protein